MVPRLDLPAGNVVIDPKLIGEGRLITFPKATVPSWQDRHIIDAPSGLVGAEAVYCIVELAYMVYVLPGSFLFQSGL